jgi:diguanylate cyclase (GGDEF)-like protein
MPNVRYLKNIAITGGAGLAYFFVGKLSLKLAFVHASATAVWPTTGLALAAFVLFGYRIWPGIFAGAFFVNVLTAGSIFTSLGIATGNTLEGVVGAYLVTRFAKGRDAFYRAQDIFKFALLAAIFSTTISATLGVTSLSLGGYANWSQYAAIWKTWWLGDAVGALVAFPLVMAWLDSPRIRWHWRQYVEAVAMLFSLSLATWAVFGGVFHTELKNYPLEFVCTPFLIWAAFKFGQRETATSVALLAGIAIWGTVHGFGPFVRPSQNTSLLLLQLFVGVMAVTMLALAAEVSERKRAESEVLRLAISDPLTGLGNYRRLLETLEFEIKRCGRTERPFSVLLLDLDGLKKINDTHGHLTGSRALCRLANVLRQHCREIDLAARYGGDEFAVVLPETNTEQASRVAQRIRDRLANDGEEPRISVSVGAAVYPDDAGTISQLLSEADFALYHNKRFALRAQAELSKK